MVVKYREDGELFFRTLWDKNDALPLSRYFSIPIIQDC